MRIDYSTEFAGPLTEVQKAELTALREEQCRVLQARAKGYDEVCLRAEALITAINTILKGENLRFGSFACYLEDRFGEGNEDPGQTTGTNNALEFVQKRLAPIFGRPVAA